MDFLYLLIVTGIIGLAVLIWSIVDKPHKETHKH